MTLHSIKIDYLKDKAAKKLRFSPSLNAGRVKGALMAAAVCVLAAVMAKADSGRLYTADRLTSSLISCISQDKYGYIWIGTENGLNKFDGYRFTNYLKDNLNDKDTTSLVSNDITQILPDSQGRMWIGSELGLMTYDAVNNRFRHYTFPSGIKPRVQDIVEDADGLTGTANTRSPASSSSTGRAACGWPPTCSL